MPHANEILALLTNTARQFFGLAVAWHIAVALALIVIRLGLLPSRRVATALLGLPFASVSALAWLAGNPFNGAVFALLSILAFVPGSTPPRALVAAEPSACALGWALVAFGWTYPHFLGDRSPLTYFYAAPLGLIPCPTLALVVGLTLVGDRLSGVRKTQKLPALCA